MRIALYLTFVLMSVAVFTSGVLSADEDTLVRQRFDVGLLVQAHQHQPAASLGAGAPPESRQARASKAREPSGYISGDMLVELIRYNIEPNSWETPEGAEVSFHGRWLQVRNRPETVKKVAAFIYQLTLEAQLRLMLSIEVVEGPSAGFPSLPDGASVSSSGSLVLPLGIERSLVRTSRVRFVADYDVEIAQASNISKPTVLSADEGLLASFVATPSIDGQKLVIEALVQTAAYDESVRRLSLGTDEENMAGPRRSDNPSTYGILELPRYEHVQMHFTTVVPASGSTFTLPVAVRGRMLELRVKTRMRSPAGTLPVFDLASLAQQPMPVVFGKMIEGHHILPAACLAPRLLHLSGDEAEPCYASSEEIIEAIRSQVSPTYWDEKGAIELLGGDRAYVGAGERQVADVRSFLLKLERQAVRSVSVDLHVWSQAGPVTTGLVKAFPREGARLVAAGRLPTLLGRAASLMAGNTANFLADYDVEVAQEARIADPMVGQSFDGLVINVLPTLAGDERTISLDVQMLLALRTFAQRPFDSGAKFLGPIDHVRQDRSVVDMSVQIPTGGTYVIDMGVDPEQKGRRLVAEIRVELP